MEMLSTGGVQRAGRHAAAVATKFASERGLAWCFLSLNDPQGLHTVRVGPHEFSISGHARDKSQFARAALRAAGRQPLLVIALHPYLPPVVGLMQFRSRKFRSIVFAQPPAEALTSGLPVVTSLNNGGVENNSHGLDGLILEDPGR